MMKSMRHTIGLGAFGLLSGIVSSLAVISLHADSMGRMQLETTDLIPILPGFSFGVFLVLYRLLFMREFPAQKNFFYTIIFPVLLSSLAYTAAFYLEIFTFFYIQAFSLIASGVLGAAIVQGAFSISFVQLTKKERFFLILFGGLLSLSLYASSPLERLHIFPYMHELFGSRYEPFATLFIVWQTGIAAIFGRILDKRLKSSNLADAQPVR